MDLSSGTDIAGMHVLDVHDAEDAAHYPLAIVASAADGRLRLKFEYFPGVLGDHDIGRDRRPVAPHPRADHRTTGSAAGETAFDAGFASCSNWFPRAAGRAARSGHSIASFQDTASRFPERVALSCGERKMTYRELDEASNQWARVLIAEGAGPDSRVAICVERSFESVAAVWAITKTGAAFVPIDPRYPSDRISFMLEDSASSLGLTTAAHRPGDGGVTKVARTRRPDEHRSALRSVPRRRYARTSVEEPRGWRTLPTSSTPRARPADPRASSSRTPVSRTSPTNSVIATVSPRIRAHCISPLRASTPPFSSTSARPSPVGGELVVAPTTVYGGTELADVLREGHVTHAFITPAALTSVDPEGIDELTTITVGGEAPSADLVRTWAPGRSFVNVYGPTETTISCNLRRPHPGRREGLSRTAEPRIQRGCPRSQTSTGVRRSSRRTVCRRSRTRAAAITGAHH